MSDAVQKEILSSRDNFYVFAYGSLMWRPGFDFTESQPATVFGLHRALCIYSIVYRGTEEKPGVVLGLDRGGSCRGSVFKVAPEKVDQVVSYLDGREMVNNAYVPCFVQARLEGGKTIKAYTFPANRDHWQYTGKLSVEKTAGLIIGGHGNSGSGLDYLANTVDHLNEMGISDGPLHRVLRHIQKPHIIPCGNRTLSHAGTAIKKGGAP